MKRALCIEIWPGDNLLDKLDTIGTCYQAVTDLIIGEDLQSEQRDNLAILMNLLGELHEKIREGLRETD